jgi:hypothetical protein
MGTGDSILF